MKAYLLARPWLSLLLLAVVLVGLLFGASALVTTCSTKQAGELSRHDQKQVEAARDKARQQARQDSTRAAHAAASGNLSYQDGKRYEDSAANPQQYEKDIIRIPASDTARIKRLWSEIFR